MDKATERVGDQEARGVSIPTFRITDIHEYGTAGVIGNILRNYRAMRPLANPPESASSKDIKQYLDRYDALSYPK